MSAHESMEHAEHAEHASGKNRKIALLIAVIALCLALSETLGKGAQTESISKNVEASNLWAFFQAKSIRRTVVQTASEQAKLSLGATGDEPPRRRCKSRSTTGRRPRRDIAPNPRPAKGPSNSRSAPSTPSTPRPRDRQISSLRTRLGGLPDRHRAGVGDHHHRHNRAGLDLGAAGAGRNRVHRARPCLPHVLHLIERAARNPASSAKLRGIQYAAASRYHCRLWNMDRPLRAMTSSVWQ